MLGIPFITSYIRSVVKEQTVADNVDWLNYYVSSILLAFFSFAISAKQYFGSPIKCWTPQEFKGGWDRYAESYCFILNSYYVPFEEQIPTNSDERMDKISYYRWVPVVLAIQALLFWLPNWLWNMLHKQTAVNPRAVINEAVRSKTLCGADRDKEIASLAVYIEDTLSVFQTNKKTMQIARSGHSTTILYLFIKFLYVFNVIVQLIMLNKFLGGEYFSWGIETFMSLVRGEDWKESAIFPRVIMCDFAIRNLANRQNHTIQCVIMMNMINEKLYFFLYFWLIFVGIVTAINFLYYLIILTVPYFRVQFILMNLNKRDLKKRGVRRKDIGRFVSQQLHSDGVLLLQFVRQHIGGRVLFDLLNELLRNEWAKENSNSSISSNDSCNRGQNYKNNIRQIQLPPTPQKNTYKPTGYGPSSLYPIMNGMSNPNHDPSTPTAPLHPKTHNNSYHDPQQIADYIDSATLPLHELYGRGTPIHGRQPTTSSTSTTTTGQDSPIMVDGNQANPINDKLMASSGKNNSRTDV